MKIRLIVLAALVLGGRSINVQATPIITINFNSSTAVAGPNLGPCGRLIGADGHTINDCGYPWKLIPEGNYGVYTVSEPNDLDGTPLAGQTITLNITCNGGLPWACGQDFTLDLLTNYPGDTGAPLSLSAHNYRQDGSSIGFGSRDHPVLAWSLPDGEMFTSFVGVQGNGYGIIATFTLPDLPGSSIVSEKGYVTQDVVPEPASAILLAVGLAGILCLRPMGGNRLLR